MDELDRAKNEEMADRQRALDAQAARARETEPPRLVDGVRVCIDCGEPIPAARLAARPESVRCVLCKQQKEHRERCNR